MRIKLNFKPNKEPINNPLNEAVNGFINMVLGKDNKYHGKFSPYSVSSMQGGKMDKNGVLNFPNGGYIYVSSIDDMFMQDFLLGLPDFGSEAYLLDMKYDGYEILDFVVNRKYDIVRTISPIITKEHDRLITFHDSDFTDYITQKSVKKLINNGIDEKIANSLKIKLFHPENAKTKLVAVKNQQNIANQVMFIIEGNKKARLSLYELGIGKCTGFGFGAVEINNYNKNF